MTNINITISLDEADRQRFDRLIAALEGKAAAPAAEPATAPSVAPSAAEVHPVDAVTPCAEPAPVAEPAPAPSPAITLAEVTALVRKLAAPSSPVAKEVKALVKSYAPKVSEIPADKLAEVHQKLTALEG